VRVVWLAPFPAQGLVPDDALSAKGRRPHQHPASWIRALGLAMARLAGVELHVVVYTRDVCRTTRTQHEGINFHVIRRPDPARFDPYFFYLSPRVVIRRYVEGLKPDIVVGYGTETGYGQVAAESPFPALISMQGVVARLSSWLDLPPATLAMMRHHEAVAVRRAACLHVETEWAREWIHEVALDRPVFKLPHAVNPEFWTIRPPFTEPRFLCVGTLSRNKNQRCVIRALARMVNRDARLVLAGRGVDEAPCRDVANALGVGDRVEFAGHLSREELCREMARARGLVIASFVETSPNVVTEAHAAGLPVVGTRVGGIPEMITHDQDGYLVAADDDEAMARHLDQLMARPEQARAMGEQGCRRTHADNDPDRLAAQHLGYYKKIISAFHRNNRPHAIALLKEEFS
jgi:glycosyltransferase involved in cell wall biosynthesis